MTIIEALDYEIAASWWARRLYPMRRGVLTTIVANYFTRKTKLKFSRYQASLEARREMEELRAEMAKRRADLVR